MNRFIPFIKLVNIYTKKIGSIPMNHIYYLEELIKNCFQDKSFGIQWYRENFGRSRWSKFLLMAETRIFVQFIDPVKWDLTHFKLLLKLQLSTFNIWFDIWNFEVLIARTMKTFRFCHLWFMVNHIISILKNTP